jgi:hypothetical protein
MQDNVPFDNLLQQFWGDRYAVPYLPACQLHDASVCFGGTSLRSPYALVPADAFDDVGGNFVCPGSPWISCPGSPVPQMPVHQFPLVIVQSVTDFVSSPISCPGLISCPKCQSRLVTNYPSSAFPIMADKCPLFFASRRVSLLGCTTLQPVTVLAPQRKNALCERKER